MKPHVHAELIKAWADGAEIDYLDEDGTWIYTSEPAWCEQTKYRIKDPYAALKAAAADPTKQIMCGPGGWLDAGYLWAWDRPPEEYQIRDKPTKVKMWQWIYKDIIGNIYTTIRFYSEAPDVLKNSTIIGPARWTEIEVGA